MALRTATEELEDLHDNSKRRVFSKISDVAETIVADNRDTFRSADLALREEILGFMQYSDLLGRKRMLLEAQAAKARNGDSKADREIQRHGVEFIQLREPGLAIRVEGMKANLGPGGPTFNQLIEDLLDRTPKLARDADIVAEFYRTTHAFAAVGAPSLKVAERVQKEVARLAAEGISVFDASEILSRMTDWSVAYAETVYRTNMTTAYAAGRWKKVSDPEVAEITPAFRYDAVGDADTRPNHQAADGLIAGHNDPIWERFSPPLGYNCRCALIMVDKFELERMGGFRPSGAVQRMTPPNFSQAGPDSARFGGGRPDRRIYGF